MNNENRVETRERESRKKKGKIASDILDSNVIDPMNVFLSTFKLLCTTQRSDGLIKIERSITDQQDQITARDQINSREKVTVD